MTQGEFEEQRAGLSCKDCGHVGLIPDRNVNNNGVRPKCPGCGSIFPVPGVQWMPKGARDRRPSGSARDLRDVWRVNGDHCSFCGKSWDVCVRLNIGRSQQHVWPVLFGGAIDGPLIPFCARCQEMSKAALKETHDIGTHLTLEETIKRIQGLVSECPTCHYLVPNDLFAAHVEQHP